MTVKTPRIERLTDLQQLFLRFEGPTTILVQSRASRISDVLTTRDMNEMADAPAGALQVATEIAAKELGETETSLTAKTASVIKEPRFSIASVQRDGKVTIKETSSFQEVMK